MAEEKMLTDRLTLIFVFKGHKLNNFFGAALVYTNRQYRPNFKNEVYKFCRDNWFLLFITASFTSTKTIEWINFGHAEKRQHRAEWSFHKEAVTAVKSYKFTHSFSHFISVIFILKQKKLMFLSLFQVQSSYSYFKQARQKQWQLIMMITSNFH